MGIAVYENDRSIRKDGMAESFECQVGFPGLQGSKRKKGPMIARYVADAEGVLEATDTLGAFQVGQGDLVHGDRVFVFRVIASKRTLVMPRVAGFSVATGALRIILFMV